MIANIANSAVLKWVNLPAILPSCSVTIYTFRFRQSSDATAIAIPVGSSRDGDAEDYLVTFPECTLSVTTIENTAICAGNALKLTSSGATSYNWLPAAGLSD